MGIFNRATTAAREKGFRYVVIEAIPHLHRHYIRDHLPRRSLQLNGIEVRGKRLFDDIAPWIEGTHPDPKNYENAIVTGLRANVEAGDTVVIVGGGWGVSSVVAAEETGSKGEVLTYEASPVYADYVEETTILNDVHDRVKVRNAVVSHSVFTFGSGESNRVVDPDDLPQCDVLEMDCEGAELEILAELDIRPRVIIVESHGMHDAPTDEVVEQLEDLSYDVVSKTLAEPSALSDICIKNDIQVITAVRR